MPGQVKKWVLRVDCDELASWGTHTNQVYHIWSYSLTPLMIQAAWRLHMILIYVLYVAFEFYIIIISCAVSKQWAFTHCVLLWLCSVETAKCGTNDVESLSKSGDQTQVEESAGPAVRSDVIVEEGAESETSNSANHPSACSPSSQQPVLPVQQFFYIGCGHLLTWTKMDFKERVNVSVIHFTGHFCNLKSFCIPWLWTVGEEVYLANKPSRDREVLAWLVPGTVG